MSQEEDDLSGSEIPETAADVALLVAKSLDCQVGIRNLEGNPTLILSFKDESGASAKYQVQIVKLYP